MEQAWSTCPRAQHPHASGRLLFGAYASAASGFCLLLEFFFSALAVLVPMAHLFSLLAHGTLVLDSLEQGLANYSYEGPHGVYFRLCRPSSLCQNDPNPAAVAQKPPWITCKRMSVVCSVQCFTDKNWPWLGFGPVGCSLSSSALQS